MTAMFAQEIRDLIKPSWVKLIEAIKSHGEMTIPELMESCKLSYMGMKQQCDALLELGYLERLRVARTEVGRPEISYRLTAKAENIFPQVGIAFSLEIFRHAKQMFGENAPERILKHYFDERQKSLFSRLKKDQPLIAKAMTLSELRQKDGCVCSCNYDAAKGLRIMEFHNPLWQIFTEYPSAMHMEKNMIAELLGSHIDRKELPGRKGSIPRIEFHIPVLHSESQRP